MDDAIAGAVISGIMAGAGLSAFAIPLLYHNDFPADFFPGLALGAFGMALILLSEKVRP